MLFSAARLKCARHGQAVGFESPVATSFLHDKANAVLWQPLRPADPRAAIFRARMSGFEPVL